MPNGVRNWPSQCDPRQAESGPCFCWEGNKHAYPSPWKFRVDVTATSPAYTWAVGSWMMPFRERVQPADSCVWELQWEPNRSVEMGKVTFDPELPDGTTISWELRFRPDYEVPSVFANGFVQVQRVLPALTLPPFTVTGIDGTWPEPVIVTPRAWDADS